MTSVASWAWLARREPPPMAAALGKARNAARRAQVATRRASVSGAMPALIRRGHSYGYDPDPSP
ncbi:MAG: hypothetical protein AAF358_15940 [Pseudomonadota bacterium]